ncbi:MAG: Maf family protein [Rickettsiales bacterium]|jgi:septum formation protein|nr:Maf family protein [Rickettsiales bacterium]
MSKIPLKHTLVLASASAIRDQLMRSLDIPFTVIRPRADEEALKASLSHVSPRELSQALARAKAASVNEIHPGWLVLGCDQVCEMDGQIFSKPKTIEAAIEQLTQLSGKTHQQHSAIALYHNGECIWETVESASLTMRTLTDEEMSAYITLDQPLQSCGAYMFEKHGKHLFSAVSGMEDVIQGLPTVALLAALYERNFIDLAPEALAG